MKRSITHKPKKGDSDVTPVYLGFLETLQGILENIFNEVLAPILVAVFNFLLDKLISLIQTLLVDVLLDGLIGLLKLVGLMAKLLDIYSGAANITYGEKSMTLLELMFSLDGVAKAMFWLMMIAGVFAFVFAAYQVGKSISDSAWDGEYKPISTVLKEAVKSVLAFALVPFLCMVLLLGSNIILRQITIVFSDAMGNASTLGVDDIIFNGVSQGATNPSTSETYQSTSGKYKDRDQVAKDFDIKKIDYVSGYTSGVLMLLLLLGTGISFIRRCFDLLLLYLVSPAFSASIPLDGGARFGKWRELFVGKFFYAFGSVISMRLYLIVVPVFGSSNVKFSGDTDMDIFMRLFLIIGGAWAIFKGSGTIAQLLGGSTAEESAAGMGIAALAGGTMGSAAGKLFGGKKKE